MEENSVKKVGKNRLFALLLAFTMTIMLVLPAANAQARRKSYAMCVLNAQVIGVNQEVLV